MYRNLRAPTLPAIVKWAGDLVKALNRVGEAVPGVVVVDHVDDEGTSLVRIRATEATTSVRVQVQSTGADKGGPQRSTTEYVSQNDYPALGWVDLEVERNGEDRYFLFVAPIREEHGAAGVRVYDGIDGEDLVRRIDLGV